MTSPNPRGSRKNVPATHEAKRIASLLARTAHLTVSHFGSLRLGFLRPHLLNPACSQIHKTTLKPATYMQSVVGRLLRMPNKQLKSLNYLSTHLLKSLP